MMVYVRGSVYPLLLLAAMVNYPLSLFTLLITTVPAALILWRPTGEKPKLILPVPFPLS